MESKVTPLVEGGLMAALTAILSLASIYLPIAGLFIEFFCAVPIVVLTARRGWQTGAAALIVSTLIIFMFTGPFHAVRISLTYGLCGLVLGYCLLRGFGAVKCFVPTLIFSFIGQFVTLSLMAIFLGVDIIGDNQQVIRESFDQSFKVYESMGVDPATIGYSKEMVDGVVQFLTLLTPIIFFFVALINTAASYLLSKWIFKKLRMKFAAPMPPFAQWRFPVSFLYVAAFAILGLYWGETRQIAPLYVICVNAMFFTMLIGLIEGLAVVSFLVEKYKISKWLYKIFCVFAILNYMLFLIVAVTGMFDIVFDYRRRLTTGGESEE